MEADSIQNRYVCGDHVDDDNGDDDNCNNVSNDSASESVMMFVVPTYCMTGCIVSE